MQTASEIPGLVPEKKNLNTYPDADQWDDDYARAFNQAINLISTKRLEVVICRENLEKALRNSCLKTIDYDLSGYEWAEIADAIILAAKQDKELCRIEVVK